MKTLLHLVMASVMPASVIAAEPPFTLVIHGGAGVSRKDLTPETEAARRKVMEAALRAGFAVLERGGAGLDAVQASIVTLEDSPHFNAGRGSVLTAQGEVEMDASIMDGASGKAGAVAGVRGIKNPIRAARLVMEKTPHVLLIGGGAEEFAREQKLDFEPMEYFITQEQKERLERVQKKARGQALAPQLADDFGSRIGTVGAVALDKAGHLSAATSTGGLTNKHHGRVGDSPIIGAGTFAQDGVCAVSCTGHGEFFIRLAVAHDVAARMKYQHVTLAAATDAIIHGELKKAGGDGGLIAVDSKGNIAAPFNTPGMFRAWMKSDGTMQVAVFAE